MLSRDAARLGSLKVVEDFFGGELGSDVMPNAPAALSKARLHELEAQLAEAALVGHSDKERASLWMAEARLPEMARFPISEYWDAWRCALPMCLYTDHIVCEDPMRFARGATTISEGMTKLVELREVVRDGHVSLSPPRLGWEVLAPSRAEHRRKDVIAAEVPYVPWELPSDVGDAVDNEARSFLADAIGALPGIGYHNLITKYMAGELLTATRLGVAPVAVASRPGLLDDFVIASSLNVKRANLIGPLVLPASPDCLATASRSCAATLRPQTPSAKGLK